MFIVMASAGIGKLIFFFVDFVFSTLTGDTVRSRKLVKSFSFIFMFMTRLDQCVFDIISKD